MSDDAETALGIARGLVADAIAHDGRCTWVGPVPELRSGRITMGARSAPPDLYAGTAGIGLVLAETAAVTGDADCATTAVAALRQSLARAPDLDPLLALGLYTGRPGIALAAIRGGLLLDEQELIERGHAMARQTDATGSEAYDLIGGRAGAVIGLLAIGAAMADGVLRDHAEGLGWELLRAVDRHGGWSWAHGSPGTGLDATGLAHGVSGVAVALLELWSATGEDAFREAADAAFAAEQRRFDPGVGNWSEDPADQGTRAGTEALMAWCHGAPGIGLARYLAWRRTGDEARRIEVLHALRVTERWARAALGANRGRFSLCHGLAGNAEMLRECRDAHPSGGRQLAQIHDDVCAWGTEEFAGRSRPWPDDGSSGLMTGRAGVARFYLKTAAGLPSLLLPSPECLLISLS